MPYRNFKAEEDDPWRRYTVARKSEGAHDGGMVQREVGARDCSFSPAMQQGAERHPFVNTAVTALATAKKIIVSAYRRRFVDGETRQPFRCGDSTFRQHSQPSTREVWRSQEGCSRTSRQLGALRLMESVGDHSGLSIQGDEYNVHQCRPGSYTYKSISLPPAIDPAWHIRSLVDA